MNEKQLAGLKAERMGVEQGGSTVGRVMDVLSAIAPGFPSPSDNEGLLIGRGDKKVCKIGVVWDLTPRNMQLMLRDGVDLIICHTYPFIKEAKEKIGGYEEFSVNDKACNNVKKSELESKGVSLIRLHTSWDNAPGGNNDVLAALLGMSCTKRLPLAKLGIIEPITLKDFAVMAKSILDSKVVTIIGDKQQIVKRVLVVAGTGFDFQEFIDYAVLEGVDVIVSSNVNKKIAKYANEVGVFLIDIDANRTETPGIRALTRVLCERGLDAEFYETEEAYDYL